MEIRNKIKVRYIATENDNNVNEKGLSFEHKSKEKSAMQFCFAILAKLLLVMSNSSRKFHFFALKCLSLNKIFTQLSNSELFFDISKQGMKTKKIFIII